MVAPAAAGHYTEAAFSDYQHKIGLRQHFSPPQIKAKYVSHKKRGNINFDSNPPNCKKEARKFGKEYFKKYANENKVHFHHVPPRCNLEKLFL